MADGHVFGGKASKPVFSRLVKKTYFTYPACILASPLEVNRGEKDRSLLMFGRHHGRCVFVVQSVLFVSYFAIVLSQF